MGIGLVGHKCGMTRIFTEDGGFVPVTVIEALPNRVTRLRTGDRDGYSALQVTTGKAKRSRLSKPLAGQFTDTELGEGLWEFRVDADAAAEFKPGVELTVKRFEAGQFVDVVGTSKGKGTAGVMKRHNFKGVSASHGAHRNHRKPGSIGASSTPSRVFKGMRMAGRMGGERVTVLNLTVHAVDAEKGLLLVKGAVPGARGRIVYVRNAVKGA